MICPTSTGRRQASQGGVSRLHARVGQPAHAYRARLRAERAQRRKLHAHMSRNGNRNSCAYPTVLPIRILQLILSALFRLVLLMLREEEKSTPLLGSIWSLVFEFVVN